MRAQHEQQRFGARRARLLIAAALLTACSAPAVDDDRAPSRSELSFARLGARNVRWPLRVVPDLDGDGYEDVVLVDEERVPPEATGDDGARVVLHVLSARRLVSLGSATLHAQSVQDLCAAVAEGVPMVCAALSDGDPEHRLAVVWIELPAGLVRRKWLFDRANTTGASACLAIDDVTGDDFPDILLGTPQSDEDTSDPQAIIDLVDGATGHSEWSCVLPDLGIGLDLHIATLDDVDRNRARRIVVASRYACAVLEIGSCATLVHIPNDFPGYATSLAAIGDVDGDGLHDFAFGCDGMGGEGWSTAEKPPVQVVSGADGRIVADWRGPSRSLFGRELAVCSRGDTQRASLFVAAGGAADYRGWIVRLPLFGGGPATLAAAGSEPLEFLGRDVVVARGPDERFVLVVESSTGLVSLLDSALSSDPAPGVESR